MNKSETNINKISEPVLTIKVSTLKRVLTTVVSLPLAIAIIVFFDNINTISFALHYYAGHYLLDSSFSIHLTGELIVIILHCVLILCIYGIVSSVFKKYSHLMFTVISAATCVIQTVRFCYKLVTIYAPLRTVDLNFIAAETALFVAYGLIVFLVAEFAGFPLINKLKCE